MASPENTGAAVRRTTQMQELRKSIEESKQKLEALENEHGNITKTASLSCDAHNEWERWCCLSDKDRRNKDYILLALKSDKVPAKLSWAAFPRHFSRAMVADRDVLLARIALPDFETEFVQEAYQVPRRLRNDKEFMLAVCSKNSHALELASKTLRNDQDIVIAAISQRFHFAPHALRFASMKLRGNSKVVSVALRREYGIQCFKYLAPKLQKNPRLALLAIRRSSEECSRFYEHLSEFPSDLLDDEDVVMAAVKKRGSNLRFATPSLQRDFDIVRAATANDSRALLLCPDHSIVRKVVKSIGFASIIHNGGGELLNDLSNKELSEVLKSRRIALDSELVLDAVDFKQSDLLSNRYFVKRALCHSSRVYKVLPRELQSDQEIVMAVLKADDLDDELVDLVMRRAPLIKEEAQAMLCLAGTVHGVLLPDAWLDVKETVFRACSVDGELLEIASDRLRNDVDVVTAALRSGIAPDSVFHIPSAFFSKHPEVAIEAINIYDGDEVMRLRNHLPPSLFGNRKVLLAWIRRGWDIEKSHWRQTIMTEGHDHNYSCDGEVHLATLEHIGYKFLFGACESCCRGSKDFMMSAVEIDGRAIVHATSRLRWDFDLLLVAVAQSCGTLQVFEHSHDHADFDCIQDFASLVRERVHVADTFIVEFLRGIAVVTPHVAPAKRCQLPKLDRGFETGAAFKMLIAEYADVPIGKELKMLRSALANLEFWGY